MAEAGQNRRGFFGALRMRPGSILLALLFALIGLCLNAGGARLLSLGGSAYYLLAGLGCLLTAWLYARGSGKALCVYLAVFIGTCIWAFAEVGTDCWQLVPRIGGPLVFAVIV